jgi:uncharacterized membrane protein
MSGSEANTQGEATRIWHHAAACLSRPFLLAGSTLWCLSIIAAPAFDLSSVYVFFSRICHQDPLRSWHLGQEPFAVCVRCASIYFAFTASLWLNLKPSVRWLRISILLLFCEFIFARFAFDNALLRSLSGILVGLAAAPFVRKALEEIRDAM